jgi:SnoaL-like domain
VEETVNTTIASDQSNNIKTSIDTIQPGERLLRCYLSALNDHNSKRASSYFTDDFVRREGRAGNICGGKCGMRASMTRLFALFPDFEMKIINIAGSGNYWGMEWSWTGVCANSTLADYARDYVQIHIKQGGSSTFQLKDGKIFYEMRYSGENRILKDLALKDYYLKPHWILGTRVALNMGGKSAL